VISQNPVTIQLRYLQTLIEVSGNQSSTIVFPLPIDVLQPLVASAQERRTAVGGDEGKRRKLDEALSAAQAVLRRGVPNGKAQQVEARTSEPAPPGGTVPTS
jgi:hypothetical protein